MVKKTVLFSVLIVFLLALPGFAERHVFDDAGVFENPDLLEAKLDELEDILGYPSYIITTDVRFDTDAKTATNLLLMDKVGKNQNGTMFTINMASRDYQFSSSGPDLQTDKLSDREIGKMIDGLGKKLKDGDFDGAGMFYYEKLRRVLDGNYLSFFDMVIAAIASLLGVGGYSAKQLVTYKRKARVVPFPVVTNSVLNLAPYNDVMTKTWETVVLIQTNNDNNSGGGGSSYSNSSGGGSFRGGGGKF